MKRVFYFMVGICLSICMSFLFYGCDSNSSHSKAYAAPPQLPAAKPPAAFSANGEFLGYVVGSGDQPQHILIYNDDIGYRFIISNVTGLIWYQGSTAAYSPDSECKDIYVIKNRYQDVIQGGSEDYDLGVWPYDTDKVTTDFTQSVLGKDIKYRKEWAAVMENGMPVSEPCEINGQQANCTVMAWQCKPYSYFVTNKNYENYPFHKVVPFTMQLPFDVPVALPIDIRVIY